MPFLAPAVPYLIQGGAALGSSLLGSKLAKSKPNAMESLLQQQTLEANKLGMDTGRGLLGESAPLRQYGASLLKSGAESAFPAANYWSTLLSGNKAGMTSLLAPELNRQAEGYRSAAQSSSALTPRGGPRADILADQPFQQQRDASTLFQTLRPQAATGLLDASRTIGNFGAQNSQLGSNLLSQAMASIFGGQPGRNMLLNNELDRRTMDRDAGKQIGSVLFDILSKMNLSNLGSGPKATGPTVLSSQAGIYS